MRRFLLWTASGCVLLQALCAPAGSQAGLEAVNEGAPEFVVRAWQMPQGLPSDRVRAVLQARDGYIWVATFNGVARFDGVRFKVFNDANTPALRNSLISCLFEDDSGRLWLGSDTGELTWYDGTSFHALEVPRAWPGFPVVGFSESRDGTLWALNRDGFLLRIRGLRGEAILGNPAGPLYSQVLRDQAGQVWAIRYGGALVRLVAGQEVLAREMPPPPAGFRTIAPARAGGLWLREEQRLRRWDQGKWAEDRGVHPWGERQAVVLFESSCGEVWVGTRDNGLFVIERDGSEHHITHSEGLVRDLITSIAEDREGNIWVGSDGGGLDRLRRRALFMVSPPDQWQHCPVTSVSAAREGGLWIGTEGAGVYLLREGQFTHLSASNTAAAKDVRTAVQDRSGRLWVGAEVHERLMNGLLVQDRSGRLSAGVRGGLFLESNGELRPYTNATDQLNMPSVFYTIFEDREGRLWMGTQSGLLRLSQGRWSDLSGPLNHAEVRCLTQTPDGALWVGMRGGGVARYSNGKFQQFLRTQGLPYGYAWALLGDTDGSVWIGTPGAGLVRWRNGQFESLTTRQGMPSDYICSILDDHHGHLWMGSYAGICEVAKAGLDRCAAGADSQVNCMVLDTSDGLASLEMAGGNQPSACQTADGRLWFATSGGLAMVEPARIQTNALAPPVLLEEALLDGKPLALARAPAGSNSAARHLAPARAAVAADSASNFPPPAEWSLQVPPGSGQIELRYTALSFCSPERVRFRYRLGRVDANWVEAGARRSAYYSHLAPGTYQFQVIACNNDGVWNPSGAIAMLKVLPFYWQTWWFAPLCWLGGIAITGGSALAALKRRHRLRIEALERARFLERERGRIARDLHDDLGSGLTDIGMTSALGHDPSVPPEEARGYFHEISQRSNELVMALDEIVWAVNPKNDDVSSLSTYFCQFAERLVRTTSLRCRFEIPAELPPLPLDAEQRHSLFLAFKEALQNAVKHSSAQGLRVRIAVESRVLGITVQDDGCGFQPGGVRAGADGLKNMRDRLEQLGGQCEIHTAPGQGTRVTFSVPLG